MIRIHDVMSAYCTFSYYLRQTGVRNAPGTHAFVTLRDDRHAWTDQNALTGKGRQEFEK